MLKGLSRVCEDTRHHGVQLAGENSIDMVVDDSVHAMFNCLYVGYANAGCGMQMQALTRLGLPKDS